VGSATAGGPLSHRIARPASTTTAERRSEAGSDASSRHNARRACIQPTVAGSYAGDGGVVAGAAARSARR